MRLVTYRTDDGTRAGLVQGTEVVPLACEDVGALLAAAETAELSPAEAVTKGICAIDGPALGLNRLDLAPVVTHPGKVLCVGLNYRTHIAEMGRAEPTHPTLFNKWADTLLGPTDPLEVPPEVELLDWEVELVIVVGRTVRRVDVDGAAAAIAGFTVGNDVSARDWQNLTTQFLPGKVWERSSPVGPWLVTADELGVRPDLEVTCTVSGTEMQRGHTRDLLFDPPTLVSFVSTFLTLHPGDLIFTGTPSGVGYARTPPLALKPGDELVTRIERIGTLRNLCVEG
ncbi:MAG TPA: fumarylacetoacetate hydrolase family protein [Acidimicrobiales bacterium]